MEFKFIPIDYDSFDFDGKNYIRLIGRTEKGEKICVVDSYEPNFWVILKNQDEKIAEKIAEKISKINIKSKGRESKVTKTKIQDKNFLGKKVKSIQVFVTNHKDAHEIASEIGDLKEIEARREYDIPLITKYIKEKKVEPLKWYTVKADNLGIEDFGGIADAISLDKCFYAKSIKEIEKDEKFEPKILAYDIETTDIELGKGDILMISLYGKNMKKVLTWKKITQTQEYVEIFKNQAEMIEKFAEYVNSYDPDILTGYFSDGFDLPYLKAASEKEKMKLLLGIDKKGPIFSRGRISSGKIAGIVHIDLYRFIDAVFSQYLQSETLGLGDVAQELIGEGKEKFDFDKLKDMKESDWKDFFSYNLQDAKVTYKLAEKIWPDIYEFTRIIKEPLFDITRDRMATHVENYLLHNLDRFNEIAEKRPLHEEMGSRRELGSYEGAFVLEPKPGLYEKIVIFDFTSFWPSIIVSYNLSRSTYREKNEKNTLEVNIEGSNKKYYFSKENGFFPEMLNEIINLRKKYKIEYSKNKNPLTKARSNAYKLLANASYGYQSFFGARYYCREAGASATAISRDFIKKTIEQIKEESHNVIYSDTDSIAFLQGKKTNKEIINLLEKINSNLPGIMELDLEDFYPRGLFVSKRSMTAGAKKKYALLSESGNFKIRGFETVRRDWCKLARNLQNEILISVLKDGNEKKALKVLREVVEKLKKREINKEDLIIRTQLKRSIKDYISTGPHVVAAKKMEERGLHINPGMIIFYFIGENSTKGKKIGDKVYLPDEKAEYNIRYYLNNQVLPAVENIFEVFNVNVKEILEGHSQKKLF